MNDDTTTPVTPPAEPATDDAMGVPAPAAEPAAAPAPGAMPDAAPAEGDDAEKPAGEMPTAA